MGSKYKSLKEECYEANMELNALGLVIYTFGNVSAVDRDNAVFAIKPSGVQAQKDIPIFGTTHADHLTQDIPCAPPMADELIEGNYELNTGIQILDCFKERKLDYQQVEMILIGNHGPFAWGKNAAKAVYNTKVLETVAQMAYLTLQINPQAPRLKDSLIKKHYERKHGKNAYYGQ